MNVQLLVFPLSSDPSFMFFSSTLDTLLLLQTCYFWNWTHFPSPKLASPSFLIGVYVEVILCTPRMKVLEFHWLFNFLSFCLLILERKGGERERHWFVVPLVYAFIGWFFYVPWPRIEPITLVYWDDTLTNWAAWSGLFSFLPLSLSLVINISWTVGKIWMK